VDNKRYEEERAEWSSLFRNIAGNEAADVSPLSVLNTLRSTETL